jgi:hypothetical protein
VEGASVVRGIASLSRPILIGQFAGMAFAVRPHVVMTLQLTCLSSLLILGVLGLPRYGAVGAAIASVVAF